MTNTSSQLAYSVGCSGVVLTVDDVMDACYCLRANGADMHHLAMVLTANQCNNFIESLRSEPNEPVINSKSLLNPDTYPGYQFRWNGIDVILGDDDSVFTSTIFDRSCYDGNIVVNSTRGVYIASGHGC